MVARLASCLRPGGWLFLEEFDDVTQALANGSREFCRLHSLVLKAKQDVWKSDCLDNHLGHNMPDWFSQMGLSNVDSDCGTRVRQTGTPGVASWKYALLGLRPKLLRVGLAKADFDAYVTLLDTTGSSYLATLAVRTWGQTALRPDSIENMQPRMGKRSRD